MMKWFVRCSIAVAALFCAVVPALGDGFQKPIAPDDYGQVILQVPYGIKNSGVKNSSGLVAQDSTVASLFVVESYHPMPLDVALKIEIPKPLKPETKIEGIEISEDADSYLLQATFNLVTEFDDWYRLVTIRIPAAVRPDKYFIRATARFKGLINLQPGGQPGGQPGEFVLHQQAAVRVVAPAELQKLLTVPAIKIPADRDGNFDEKCAQNSLLLRTGLGILGKVFGSRQEDDAAPAAFAGIKMANRAAEDAIVLVSWQVLDRQTKEEAEGFRIPQEFLDLHGGGDDRIYTQVFIPGKEMVELVLPIFADKHKVLAGRYLGRVKIRLFGSDATVGVRDFDLTVKKMSWSSIGTTLYAMLVALCVGIVLLIRNRAIFQRFKSRWLILIALFGSTKFLVSLVPRFFLNELFNGLLGPFAAFATGLFREGITNLFVMALVVLIPLPGVVTLSMLISLVLFCLLGSFNPVIILFMVVAMSTMEIALYLTGFTRGPQNNFTRTPKALIMAALGMGTAGAFATFVDYNLYMLLYRLYYANWFIWANILIVGFLYTAIFAPAGVMLGNKLKRVATQ
ncbi:MAG: hypothetical protein PVH87_13965 [Desulfobacteraceae bacterium]|jgi:hypothetical protein